MANVGLDDSEHLAECHSASWI